MEIWINASLDIANLPPISFAQQNLSMRYIYLVKRNIYLFPNFSICFMDWAFSGFFPGNSEIYIFRELLYKDEVSFDQFLHLSSKPDISDEQLLQYLGIPGVVNNTFA